MEKNTTSQLLEKICTSIEEIKQYIIKNNEILENRKVEENNNDETKNIIKEVQKLNEMDDYTKIILKDFNSRISILEEESQSYNKNI